MKINTRNPTTVLSRCTRLPLLLRGFLGVLLTAALLVPAIAISQWSDNPIVNNPIADAANDQVNSASVSDGAGGAIIAWQDKRNGSNYGIYAQRISAGGAVQWTPNGVTICLVDSDQVNPAIISDGSGGAIIAWQDKRSGSYDIYAQRINASGVLQWSPSTGDSVCKAVFDQANIAMVSDGSGGALLAWEDYRSNAGPGLADIYTQKVNATGVHEWQANGIGVCIEAHAQHGPKIISDGNGGAFLTWYDHRAVGDYDIYAQRVSNIGGFVGSTDGVAVCTSGSDQTNPDMCTDGAGGAIIVWQDSRSTTDIDIWAQRMSAAVGIVWITDGIVMNNNVANDQINPKIVSDGIGGALMTWEDFFNGTTSDIRAQRVASTGLMATGWDVNGVAVCVSAGNQSNPQIISDSSHGAIITWADKRDDAAHSTDIYASRITGVFALPWTANGVPVCTADSTQTSPTVVSDGSGGAIIAWQDKRSGDYDIYASRVNQDGVLPVEIVAFTATANRMNADLRWSTATEVNNYGFEIERRQNADWAKVGFVTGAGTSNAPRDYSYTDNNLSSGRYTYRLKQIDNDGAFSYHGSVEVAIGSAPQVFALSQNYPNPFNPSTVISYQLPVNSQVTLKVYDVLGNEVATLVNGRQEAGSYTVPFSAIGGSTLASGVYIYRLQAGSFVSTKKLVVMK